MLCPYFLGLSVYLYNDLPTLLFLVLGLFFWARGHAFPAAIAFALAISPRQYAVLIPAVLALAEAGSWLTKGSQSLGRAITVGLAACTLLIWFSIWGE